MISEKLKARFCKDYGIPIKVYSEPYFTERALLFGDLYGAMEKYVDFRMELSKYANESDFLDYNAKIVSDITDAIRETEGYTSFINEDMSKFTKTSNYSRKDIYSSTNIDKLFISIDMIKANFSSLHHYNAEIFKGANSWVEFVNKFTSSKYIMYSKHIRQIIFSNCSEGRQRTYQLYLMLNFLDTLANLNLNVVSLCRDEIVIDATDIENLKDVVDSIKSAIASQSLPLRLSTFTLKDLYRVGYKREFSDGSFDIKGVDANYLPMVVRMLKGETITDNDKVFLYNKNLCTFVDLPFKISE